MSLTCITVLYFSLIEVSTLTFYQIVTTLKSGKRQLIGDEDDQDRMEVLIMQPSSLLSATRAFVVCFSV